MKRNDLVEVEWRDSRGTNGAWEYEEELSPLPASRILTVGHLIRRDEVETELAQSRNAPDTPAGLRQMRARITIPNCAIIAIRRLSVSSGRGVVSTPIQRRCAPTLRGKT